jgi:hypothetical protein
MDRKGEGKRSVPPPLRVAGVALGFVGVGVLLGTMVTNGTLKGLVGRAAQGQAQRQSLGR